MDGEQNTQRGSVDRSSLGLEDLVGGRVLAWVGGVAVLAGLAYFLALAIAHGWIGEGMRTLLAGVTAAGLVGAGTWLHERRGRTDAAIAATAAGIAGLFLTAAIATQVYAVIPLPLGLAMAMGAGAVAVALAVRWQARFIGALGIVGALLAPVIVGAPPTLGTLALLFVAAAAAAAVLVWQRWEWLGFAAFLISTPQWIRWLAERPSAGAAVLVLLGFGAVFATAAVGFEVRAAATRLRPSSALLLALNAIVLAAGGWIALAALEGRVLAELWILALAAVHLGLGLLAPPHRRTSIELRRLSLVLGVLLADLGAGLVLDGAPLAVAWAGGAALFALVRRGTHRSGDDRLSELGLGFHVALALLHVLLVDAPPALVAGGGFVPAGGLLAVGAVAAAALSAGYLLGPGRPELAVGLEGLGLAAIAYLTALGLDGPALVAAWAGEAVVLGRFARHTGEPLPAGAAGLFLLGAVGHALLLDAPPAALRDAVPLGRDAVLSLAGALVGAAGLSRLAAGRSRELEVAAAGVACALGAYLTAVVLDGPPLAVAWAAEAVLLAVLVRRRSEDGAGRAGTLALLGLAAAHVLRVEAPPESLGVGVGDLAGAALALAAIAIAALACARAESRDGARAVLAGGAALAGLYLASVAVVTAFQPGTGTPTAALLELDVRQQGQALLSSLWTVAGVAALVLGLRRDRVVVRRAALALLCVAIAKVFLHDLASLTSIYRVASLVALGVLLLVAAFSYQRLRPRPLPDLRGVPRGLR